jgi:GMP synthase-like glutamine amidotransferase
MNADDDDVLPWLTAEKRLIGEAVREGVPYWGVCLGAQLLARALGAPVHRDAATEVGVAEVRLTTDGELDPVLGVLPREFRTLQWHSDTFEIPSGGRRLASSSVCANQAFRAADLAYGLQFHLEVSPDMCLQWTQVPAYARSLRAQMGSDASERLLEEVSTATPQMRQHAVATFSAWLALASTPVRSIDPVGQSNR